MLKDKPSAAVRQSKRKLGLAEESLGRLLPWEGERFASNRSGRPITGLAAVWGTDAVGEKARLVAYPVAGNPPKIARQANQQKSSNLFVNDRSPHNYLSILKSKKQ